ncbi:MAG: 1-phosphofructokinase [Anaerolineae bacterium]
MIATVTLNPAVDQTVKVDNFEPNTVNRGQSMQFDPGGKGVNVASFLADAGHRVAVTGFLGEENTHIFERLFARKGMADHFVRIPGRTRTGVKIVDPARQQTTDINMPGQAPPDQGVEALFETVDALSERCEWFVLTGSLPPGVPTDLYGRLIRRLKSREKRTVLDTSRDGLRDGVLGGPTILKPNREELQQIVGQTLADHAAMERAARALREEHGIEIVVVSLGAEGALFIDGDTSLLAVPPAVTVESTVGAGDAMVAGLVAGQTEGLSLTECARLSTAFSVGAITHIGASLPPSEELQRHREGVSIKPLKGVT